MVMSRADWVDRLVAVRDERGWSARELARRMGVSHSTVAGWEQRRVAKLSLEAVGQLAKAFGVRSQTMGAYLSGDISVAHLMDDEQPALPADIDPDTALFYEGWQLLTETERQAVKDVMLKAMIRRARGEDA